jgi:hypothetical protein
MAKKIQDGNQIVTNVDSNDNLTFSIKSSFILPKHLWYNAFVFRDINRQIM